MPKVKKARRRRRDPKPGTVVRVALPHGRYAYLCAVRGLQFWLYDFVSAHPLGAAHYFSPSRWKVPTLWSELLADYVNVCELALSKKEMRNVAMWQPVENGNSDFPTGIAVYDPVLGCHRVGTVDEIQHMARREWFSGEGIVPWIM